MDCRERSPISTIRLLKERVVLNQVASLAIVSAWIVLLVSTQARAQTKSLYSLEQDALRAAASHVADSVVQIETLGGLEKVGRVLVGTGPTTGLIISEDGYIISSAFNFIQKPTSILVTLPNGKRKPAKIVSRDNSRMLVLLKVERDELLTVPVAAPRDELSVGQWTVAVGRTYGASNVSISVGILSATNRIWGKALQTDAKVSPGNYGGPLVDIQGRVLGVLVPLSPDAQSEVAGAEWYDSGIGFAIPLADVLGRFEELKGGDLHAGVLGISFKGEQSVSGKPVIGVVQVNSPADEAGLEADDTIIEANGVAVSRQSQLRHVLGPLYAGDKLHLVVMRGDDRVEVTATLVDKLIPYEHPFIGLLPRRDIEEAVSVRWVYPDSPANDAGLLPGDVIQQISEKPIGTADELRQRISNFPIGETIAVQVERDGQIESLEIKLGSLPEDIPDRLPAAEEVTGESPEVETGRVEIQIPEESNKCVAFVPQNYDSRKSYGVLISLHPPGKPDPAPLIERWKPICEQHNLILLLPQSGDAARWQPTEEAFIRKTIDDLVNRYPVDQTRIVIHGYQGGGAMSYLTAFKQRDVVRGVVAIDAALPLRMAAPQNAPLQRLAIVTGVSKQSKMHERVTAGVQALRERKFPVSVMDMDADPRQLNDDERAQVGRWIDSLDRI